MFHVLFICTVLHSLAYIFFLPTLLIFFILQAYLVLQL